MQVGAIQQALLKYVPPLRWCKRALMMKIREVSHRAIVTPDSAYSQKMIQWAAAAMKKQLSDRPDLWGVLTPDYAPGCKRVLISDDYYQALGRANVVLETRRIRRVTEAGIETDDGEIQEVDLIVCATGFKSVEFLHPIEVYGKGGRPLQEIWKNGGEAYYGIGVEDLPNFGMLYGPNTNLGESSTKFVKTDSNG
jgi:cation diffusion facilitator CzcD-associated flavoprotein CzcO